MKKKVLIVDDNSNNLYIMEVLLKAYGMEVISADNGKDALDKARLDPPNLIVTDILMPLMDGYTLCRHWKSDDMLKHIPLVFYTATYTESKDEAFALSLGADRFIIKPQEPVILMNILNEVLNENYEIKQVEPKPLGEEMEFFRQYNEILFNKLEKKMLGLENANDEIKKLNTTLEQRVIDRTTQLDASNKELEAFAYSVSHDLKAPLRAIDGFSRLLLEDYQNKIDDEGKRLLNIIRNNTQKMNQLITDILSLSKITRSEIKFSRIDMNTHANSIYNEVTTYDVRQKFEFNVISLPDAFGDTNLIRQVWVNLISNAVKYTMKSETKRIEIGGKVDINNCIYYIKDTGAGFNPDFLHKLFGVFQRLHKSEEFEGTGIGLAIVQRIINRHGGKVWAEGKVNEGATFYFSLPCKEGENK